MISQKQRPAEKPRPVPEHLLTGSARAPDERLIGGDTGLAAVMARARMVKTLRSMPGAGQDSEIYAFASDVDADQRMEIERMSAMLAMMKEPQK